MDGIRQFGWVMQALGAIVVGIGLCIFLVLFRVEAGSLQATTVWRIGVLFVGMGGLVYALGRLGGRRELS
jgi:hypothetical protein